MVENAIEVIDPETLLKVGHDHMGKSFELNLLVVSIIIG